MTTAKVKTVKATYYFESGMGGLVPTEINLIEFGEKEHSSGGYKNAFAEKEPFIKYKKKGGRNIECWSRPSRDLLIVKGWGHELTSGCPKRIDAELRAKLDGGSEGHAVFEFNYGDKTGTNADLEMVRGMGVEIICDYFG